MKAFVIKVKENCYWLGGFYGKNNYDDIARAKVYVNKTRANKQCELVNESYGHNAEVVKITIAEGDLEQENKQLKEQLAEKDRFIKILQEDNRSLRKGLNTGALNYAVERTNTIRKQVCDEIREKSYPYRFVSNEPKSYIINEEILDQIEKGE